MTFDKYVHIAELLLGLIFSPVVWKFNRALNRYLDERENFPPHRHGRGKELGEIYYPKGLRPNGD